MAIRYGDEFNVEIRLGYEVRVKNGFYKDCIGFAVGVEPATMSDSVDYILVEMTRRVNGKVRLFTVKVASENLEVISE